MVSFRQHKLHENWCSIALKLSSDSYTNTDVHKFYLCIELIALKNIYRYSLNLSEHQ